MDERMDVTDLAKAIYEMRFTDLQQVGEELWRMTQEDDGPELWDLKQRHTWAQFLAAWAESKLED